MNPEDHDSIETSRWNLLPLTPEYLETEHGRYVSALEDALKNGEMRNIALSGSYGVGKSSILRELGRRLDGRAVQLSLLTLAPIEGTKLDESVPIQASTPTNRIQQEIVKQLLYREKSGKAPASRFLRIEGFQWWRETIIAVLLGVIFTVIFLLAGWTVRIVTTFTILKTLESWIHLVVWFFLTCTILILRWLLYGRIRIKQFSAGAATITLGENSISYFDQYLDEIIYFFEVSKYDVVLFEDIDRFDDLHIFETLHALNALLNASPQIKKTIHFIYAIKDSIFDEIELNKKAYKNRDGVSASLDSAQTEIARANRTKFFDLVISVVPFITHSTARNLSVQLLGDIKHEVNPELLDLAAKYVPDMRLLKNVRNEFIIFREHIFSGDGARLGLDESELYAMMLYKSTHIKDFENIRLDSSSLDTLYKISRKCVAQNIEKLKKDCRILQQNLRRIDEVEARSNYLGQRLLEHIERVAIAAGHQSNPEKFEFTFGGETIDDIRSAQFWRSLFQLLITPNLNVPLIITRGYCYSHEVMSRQSSGIR